MKSLHVCMLAGHSVQQKLENCNFPANNARMGNGSQKVNGQLDIFILIQTRD